MYVCMYVHMQWNFLVIKKYACCKITNHDKMLQIQIEAIPCSLRPCVHVVFNLWMEDCCLEKSYVAEHTPLVSLRSL